MINTILDYCTVDNILQTMLLICGVTSFLLISLQSKISIWGYRIGVVSQPLWFFIAYSSNQWALVLMTPFYFFGYLQGMLRFHEK